MISAKMPLPKYRSTVKS